MPQLLTALVTPFTLDLKIDFKALGLLIQNQLAAGVSGLVILGTTGEAELLTDDEKTTLIDFVFQHVPKNFPITLGCSHSASDKMICFAKSCLDWPIKELMVLIPPYLRPSSEGLIAHYKRLSDAKIPFMVYHHPGRTGSNPSIDTLRKILSLPFCRSLKDASGACSIMDQLASEFCLFSGDDGLILPHLSLGAAGLISVASNLIPAEFNTLITLFKDSPEKALQLFRQIKPLLDTLAIEPNPIAIKGALHLSSHIENALRLPYTPAPYTFLEKLQGVLAKISPNAIGEIPTFSRA